MKRTKNLKVELECFSCLIHRGYLEIAEATQSPVLQFQAAAALLDCMAKEFRPEAVAAVLGTMRDRIVKQVTRNPDVYRAKKYLSNQKALEILPSVKALVEKQPSSQARFRKASLAAIVGNVIEFDIPQHEVGFDDLAQLFADAEKDLAIDDIEAIYGAVAKSREILFLTDNAGEIVFDKILVGELRQLGSRVTVAVKGGPILNDATLEDARLVGMHDLANRVITTGADAVGMPVPKERSKEFVEAYDSADLVIAKGMGYAETLTETRLKQPHAFLLRTKCSPVASHFGVQRGKNVAKFVKSTRKGAEWTQACQ